MPAVALVILMRFLAIKQPPDEHRRTEAHGYTDGHRENTPEFVIHNEA